MDGSDRVSGPLWITSEPLVGTATSSSRAKMALFPECRLTCAQNMLDSADIVREGIYRQLTPSSDLLHDLRLRIVRYLRGKLRFSGRKCRKESLLHCTY